MRAPVGDFSGGIIGYSAPSGESFVRVVVFGERSGALPQVPVEARGDGLRRQHFRVEIFRQSYLYSFDFAERAASDGVGYLQYVGLRAANGTRLPNAAGVQNGVPQDFSLLDCSGQRFFAVNVLAGGDGVHCGYGVPMVGQGNHYGVDVLAGENFAVIVIAGYVFAEKFFRVLQAERVGVVVSVILLSDGVVDVA